MEEALNPTPRSPRPSKIIDPFETSLKLKQSESEFFLIRKGLGFLPNFSFSGGTDRCEIHC